MPYCSKGDLISDMGQKTLEAIADRVGEGKVDQKAINFAILKGQMDINSKIANRYSVPFADGSVPTVISYACVSLTKWYLINGSIQPDTFAPGLRSAWSMERATVMRQLSSYSIGVQVIPNATRTGTKAKMSTGLAGDNVEREFTLTRFEVDGSTIDTGERGTLDVL